jgi:hypothetical protein
MPDFTLTGPEGQSFTLTGPEGATEEQAREVAAAHLARGAVRGGPGPEPEVPKDYQTWGNLAEATAENYPHVPQDIRGIPGYIREHPEEISSIGMGGIVQPSTRAALAALSPREIRARLDTFDQALREGRITQREHEGFREAMGLPPRAQVSSISAQTNRPINPRTIAEMRATPPEQTEQAMVRRAVQGPQLVRSQPQDDMFRGPTWGDDHLKAKAMYDQLIAPHFPDQKAFLESYFGGALPIDKVTVSTATDLFGKPGIAFSGDLYYEGMKFGTIERRIFPGPKLADHDFLEINEKARGGGFVKRMSASQIALYQKIGIERVHLLANVDVGGYAWAKYGWLPTQQEWPQHAVSIGMRLETLTRRGLIDPAEAQQIRGYLNAGDPRHIWTIADIRTPFDPLAWGGKYGKYGQYHVDEKINTVGKALLAGQSWGGELHLSDPAQMRRFNKYVSGQ